MPDTTEDAAAAAALEPKVCCRKVRFYPTKKQKELLTKCADANRFMFNAANAFVKAKVQEVTASRLTQLRCRQRDGFDADVANGRQVQTPPCAHVFATGKRKGQWCTGCVADGEDFFCPKHSKKHRRDNTDDVDGDDDDDKSGGEAGRLGISYARFLNLPFIREHVLVPDSKLSGDHPQRWLKDVPYDTRQLAIKELVTAWKSALTNKRRGHIKRFDVGFKKKKNKRQIFQVNDAAFDPTTRVIFKTRGKKGGGKLRVRRRDASKVLADGGVTGDFVVQLVRPNRWYLCLTKLRKEPELPIFANPVYHSVFIDPGVRTFATLYSPDGVVGKIGDRYTTAVLEPLALQIDRLQAAMARARHKKRSGMKRRVRKLQHRISCLVDELHHSTCTFLCTMFQTIFIPKFEAGRMSELPGRRINCRTTRNMMSLSHGRFLERLKASARAKQRTVVVVSEGYTTKTCDMCGVVNDKVGGASVFRCGECGHVADRDVHAARNIALRTVEALDAAGL